VWHLLFTTRERPARDIHIFVANPVLGLDPVEDARAAQRGAVVATAVDGVGDPAQSTGQVADNLDVQAGRVVFAGVELRVVVPAPAVPSTISCSSPDSSSAAGVNGRNTRASSGVITVIAREIVDRDTP
jgi:hypothetical protein